MLYIYNNQMCFKESFVVINRKYSVLGGNSIFKVQHEIVLRQHAPIRYGSSLELHKLSSFYLSKLSSLYLGLGHLSSHPAIAKTLKFGIQKFFALLKHIWVFLSKHT